MRSGPQVKVKCPKCGNRGEVPLEQLGNQYGIDDAKCSLCFKHAGTFVNLVRLTDEELLEEQE